jgi:hypothetical protein
MIMDTYKAVQKLVNIGIKKEHAVAFTEIINEQNSDLATKSDLALVKSELKSEVAIVKKDIDLVKKDIEHIKEQMATKSDMANLRTELKDDISDLKDNMAKLHANTIKWIFGLYLTSMITIIFSSPIIKVIQQYTL